MNRCVVELARDASADLHASDPAHRLQGMAFRLRDLAAADDAGIQSWLGEFLAYRRSRKIEALQRSLASAAGSDLPAGWASELKRLIEANARALSANEPARLAGWPEDADVATCATLFRAQARALAAGLEAWPEVWAWGREHGEAWLERLRIGS
jgi:hypothetical protein